MSRPQPGNRSLSVSGRCSPRWVEDWEHVTLDERKKAVASIFETITADPTADVLLDCAPRESWKDYVRAVVPATKTNESTPIEGGSERKTGVKHAEVVTARLVKDERGWLRLAGLDRAG
jgi:hypothetical protein